MVVFLFVKAIFQKLVMFFRSRFFIHMAGAVLVSEIMLSFLSLLGSLAHFSLSGKSGIFYSAIAAPVVGFFSELNDILTEHPYPNKGWKHFYDIMTWVFGGLVFIGLELLQ